MSANQGDRERFLQFRTTILKRVYVQEGGRMLASVAGGQFFSGRAARSLPPSPCHQNANIAS